MTPTRRRRRLAVLSITAVLAAVLAPTATGLVTLDVTVDGTPIRDGGSITVTEDPELGVDVGGDESIESVTIRVDGETRASFEPNTTALSERLTLDLTDGNHTVSVAVAPGNRTLTATVRKDSTGPIVTVTSPFESAVAAPTGQVAIDHGAATLAADLDDPSGVREVRIERVYEWRFGGQSRRSVETYRIENPGDNVSQPILFGHHRNELRIEAVDVHGQRRTYDVVVWVIDEDRPRIALDRVERSGGRLRVAGTVSDGTKVDSLSYRVGRSAQRTYVLNPTSPEPTRSRVDADFEFTARVGDDAAAVTVVATDVVGNTLLWAVPLDYRGSAAPTMTVDESATRAREGGVEVVGSVVGGWVTTVVVESVDAEGAVVDAVTVYDGAATDDVQVRDRVGAARGATTVVIRAVDVSGESHRASVTLGASTPTETPVASSPTGTPTRTPTVEATPVTTMPDDGGPTTRGRGSLPTALAAVGILGGLLLGGLTRRR
ncbi:hypothetical protein [Haloplanus rubicundus]|uniref:Uncharacterized protein n=1 Tax=Haloplanus rubicundus TaxID=1547898 RepID=A0A345E9R4_9EURY|nr:hypothetical protein [Haloplanus rubicundus]AXG08936.1 hypothetical protein DU484_03130 [Haloplanus rubicundus]